MPTGTVFPDSSDTNITEDADDDGVGELKVGVVFNLATPPAIGCRIVAKELWVIDLVTLHSNTTEQLGRALSKKNPPRH